MWENPRLTTFEDPSLTARLNKLESVMAQLAKDMYADKTDATVSKVTDIPEITRLQRENEELKRKVDHLAAEARRWKEAAGQHNDLLNVIADDIAAISDTLVKYQ